MLTPDHVPTGQTKLFVRWGWIPLLLLLSLTPLIGCIVERVLSGRMTLLARDDRTLFRAIELGYHLSVAIFFCSWLVCPISIVLLTIVLTKRQIASNADSSKVELMQARTIRWIIFCGWFYCFWLSIILLVHRAPGLWRIPATPLFLLSFGFLVRYLFKRRRHGESAAWKYPWEGFAALACPPLAVFIDDTIRGRFSSVRLFLPLTMMCLLVFGFGFAISGARRRGGLNRFAAWTYIVIVGAFVLASLPMLR